MMETCTPRVSLTHQGEWGEVVTPLRVGAWDRGLAGHPDRRLVEYIVRGIREGFRIGGNVSASQRRGTWGRQRSTGR